MILHLSVTTLLGRTYSTLVVTYPPNYAPQSILALAVRGLHFHKFKNSSPNLLRKGEVLTTLPFKVVRVALNQIFGSVHIFANDDFLTFNQKDYIAETSNIILVIKVNNEIDAVDGLSYLLNELEKNNISSKLYKLFPYFHNDSFSTVDLLKELREINVFTYNELSCFPYQYKPIDKQYYLPFVNLANSYFYGTLDNYIVSEPSSNSPHQPLQNFFLKRIITSKKTYQFSFNLENAVNVLRTNRSGNPVLVNEKKGNEILLRSIAISNWLMKSSKFEDKSRGGELVFKCHLPTKSWVELAKAYIWSIRLDEVTWMGNRSIPFIREASGYIKSKQLISLIKRRSIILTLFPLFILLNSFSWIWVSLSYNWSLIGLLSLSAISILGPLLTIDIIFRLARVKISKTLRYSSSFSFILFGLLQYQDKINLPNFNYPAIYVCFFLMILMIWMLFPLNPRQGKILFGCSLFAIPFSSILINNIVWTLYFHLYQNGVNLMSDWLLSIFESFLAFVRNFL